MPFGLGIGQVVALVRETRGFEGALPQISVSGEGASELALALSHGRRRRCGDRRLRSG